jgi:type I restriction enzyme S subunit
MLFGRRRAYLKKAAIAPFDGVCSRDITIIEAKPDLLLPELLPFIIQNDAFFDYAVGKSVGSLSPRAHWNQLKDFEFNLPAKHNQHYLASLFWSFVETRNSYKNLITASDDLVKSQFVEMFGDPVRNDKEWDSSLLGNLADVLTGYRFDSSKHTDDGIKICGGLIITPDRIAWEDANYWENANGLERHLLEEDDLVLALNRPWIPSGLKIAQISPFELPALLNQRTARIRGISINPTFLLWMLKSERFKLHCKITATTVPYISLGDIKDYEVFTPPLNLQNRFADFVRQADKSVIALKRMLYELEALYKAILRETLG